jgi:hypothetical protein
MFTMPISLALTTPLFSGCFPSGDGLRTGSGLLWFPMHIWRVFTLGIMEPRAQRQVAIVQEPWFVCLFVCLFLWWVAVMKNSICGEFFGC